MPTGVLCPRNINLLCRAKKRIGMASAPVALLNGAERRAVGKVFKEMRGEVSGARERQHGCCPSLSQRVCVSARFQPATTCHPAMFSKMRRCYAERELEVVTSG